MSKVEKRAISEAKKRAELMTREEPLLPELRPFVVRNTLHHRLLIDLHLDQNHAGLVNDRYREVSRKAEDALGKRNWSAHIFLHERPYRIGALTKCINLGLSGPAYWRLVGHVWVDSENIHQNLEEWRKVWRSAEPGREECMDDKERAALAEFPDWVRVWRGTGYKRSVRGISWTTDREKAEWFARRFDRTSALVAEGTVAKRDVRAVFLGGNESEVASLSVKIENVTPLGPPGRGTST